MRTISRTIVTALVAGAWALPVFSGTLGTWQKDAVKLPGMLFCHQAVAVGNRIVVVGGHGSGKRLAKVWSVDVAPDGALGSWRACSPLPPGKAGTQYHTCATWRNFVYVLGGVYVDEEGSTGQSDQVWVAEVLEDGTLSPWRQTESLPEPRQSGAAMLLGDRFYYLGGQNRREIYSAKIHVDGLLGPWEEVGKLPTTLSSSFVFFDRGSLFAVGGNLVHGQKSDRCYRAPITPEGLVGEFRRTESLPEPSSAANALRVGNQIILVGGNQGERIYRSSVAPDLHLADWESVGAMPREGMSEFQTVRVGTNVFVLGGIILGTPNVVLDTIYRIGVEP